MDARRVNAAWQLGVDPVNPVNSGQVDRIRTASLTGKRHGIVGRQRLWDCDDLAGPGPRETPGGASSPRLSPSEGARLCPLGRRSRARRQSRPLRPDALERPKASRGAHRHLLDPNAGSFASSGRVDGMTLARSQGCDSRPRAGSHHRAPFHPSLFYERRTRRIHRDGTQGSVLLCARPERSPSGDEVASGKLCPQRNTDDSTEPSGSASQQPDLSTAKVPQHCWSPAREAIIRGATYRVGLVQETDDSYPRFPFYVGRQSKWLKLL